MNIYAISDMHGNLPEVPRDADVVLLAGDICPDFRPMGKRSYGWVDESGQQQAHWLDTDFRDWLDRAQERPIEFIAIWGNHDFIGEKKFLIPSLPWTLLQDSEAVMGGLRIYGTPWVPGLPSWAFYGRPEALQARAEAIPEGIDILMTHGPPHGVADYIPTSEKQRNKYGNFGGANVGDPTLNDVISRVKPRVTICGHIHEARGHYTVPVMDELPVFTDDVKPLDIIGPSFRELSVVNVAAVDEVYRLHPQPFTLLREFA